MQDAARDVEVCPVQLPGRETRISERALTNIHEMANALAEQLAAHAGSPFALFGHSMGALLSFETARALRRSGAPAPQRLFLSAHRAPHLPHRGPRIHALDDAAFIAELKLLQGISEDVTSNAELMAIVLPTLRADVRACETYELTAEKPLSVPFSVFGATGDPKVDRDELEAWGQHTTAGITLREFPGHHFFLHGSRRRILDDVDRDLQQREGAA